MRRLVLVLGVLLSLMAADVASATAPLRMSEARSWARAYGDGLVIIYDADDYVVSCGRTGRFSALCRVRLYGADGGSYNCLVYAKVYVSGNKIRGKPRGGTC